MAFIASMMESGAKLKVGASHAEMFTSQKKGVSGYG